MQLCFFSYLTCFPDPHLAYHVLDQATGDPACFMEGSAQGTPEEVEHGPGTGLDAGYPEAGAVQGPG